MLMNNFINVLTINIEHKFYFQFNRYQDISLKSSVEVKTRSLINISTTSQTLRKRFNGWREVRLEFSEWIENQRWILLLNTVDWLFWIFLGELRSVPVISIKFCLSFCRVKTRFQHTCLATIDRKLKSFQQTKQSEFQFN